MSGQNSETPGPIFLTFLIGELSRIMGIVSAWFINSKLSVSAFTGTTPCKAGFPSLHNITWYSCQIIFEKSFSFQ